MKSSLKKLTNEVFNSAADFLLWNVGLFGASFGKNPTSRGAYQIFNEASEFLQEVNHETVRSAWQKLKREGFIEIIKQKGYYQPVLTALAKKRLNSLVPEYQKHRPWNKRIYIVTYDIPEKKREARNLLRENIEKLSAAMIQKSVWICPYDIKNILNDFIKEVGIEGTIIVSDTGTDGVIGNQSIEELIISIYRLEDLNQKYEEFISLAKEKKNGKDEMITLYLSILKDDPQLPFELLPYWWLGDEAYSFYQKLTKEKVKKTV